MKCHRRFHCRLCKWSDEMLEKLWCCLNFDLTWTLLANMRQCLASRPMKTNPPPPIPKPSRNLLEMNLPLWMISMAMRKVLGTVDYNTIFQSLRIRRLPEIYVTLLQNLYSNQQGSVNKSILFFIQRSVK